MLEFALGATPLGLVENPSFFHGFAARPEVVSCALLAGADVAASRSASKTALEAKRLASRMGLVP